MVRASRNPQRLVVVGLGLLGVLLHLRFLLQSDPGYLATVLMQDDSFYYLQPAWMFKQIGTFTADGETPTYGFQPLWMLVSAGVAYVSPDKITLLRGALILGAIFYWATGVLLHRLSERWATGWTSTIAPAVWLVNPTLRGIYTTGKENALYAFLLVGALLVMYRLHAQSARRATYVGFGVVCGLLVLCRVNSLVVVILMIATVVGFTEGTRRDRALRGAHMLAGLLIAVLPWFAYAHSALGTIFPNSGTQKLIGAQAGLTLYVHEAIPALSLDRVSALLSPDERPFLRVPERLVVPSTSFVFRYALVYLSKLSIGFWINPTLAVIRHEAVSRLWVPQTIAIGAMALLSILGLILRASRRSSHGIEVLTTMRRHLPIVLLSGFAALNALIDGFLLPSQVYYATWYAVPETIAYVLLASFAGLLAFSAARQLLPLRGARVLLTLMLVGGPIYVFAGGFAPRAYGEIRRPGGSLHEVWEARPWIEGHLPAGARIGAMSSGLLGYIVSGRTVINLDGLANSPQFVRAVWLPHMFYFVGVASEDTLWTYIREKRIEFMANAEVVAHLGRRPFLGVVPPENYEVLYQGVNSIDWGEPDGPRRFVVVRLHY